MKKCLIIIVLAAILTLCDTMIGFAQKPEDLRGIPGTWFFLAKLDRKSVV